MFWFILIGLPALATVSRALRNGFTWFDVVASFSQVFNWWLGGDIQDTLSCRTAQETFAGTSPRFAWRGLHIFLDFIALPFELDHCVARMIAANDESI